MISSAQAPEAVDGDVVLALEVLPAIVRLVSHATADGSQYPLTMTQYRLLRRLDRGPRRTCDLAAALDVTPTTVSATIDTLVRRGLVERLPRGDDRRTVPLAITVPGREALAAGRARQAAALRELGAGLSPHERRALTTGLSGVARALRFREASAPAGSA